VPTPVTVVWGPTGAPGRTTVAVTLAAQLAAGGVRTLLVDLDTWGACVAQVLGMVDEAPGVAAAARASEQGRLDVPALARLAPEVVPRLRVLTGLPRADRWPELRSGAVEDVLRLARSVADHVVVDTGFAVEDDEELSYDTAAPRRNASTLAALEAADRLVVVGAADPVGLQRLVRAVQGVAVLPSPPPLVVVNKTRASAAGPQPERSIGEVLQRFAGLEAVRFLPWAPQECDEALLAGRALTETSPRAPFTLAVAGLAAELDPRVAPAVSSGRRGGRRGRAGGRGSGSASRGRAGTAAAPSGR
jgi:MinD-like ATPase involved in chromosome partitioning or flagellar assembly